MASRPHRLLAVGLVLVVLAGVHWIWLASTDRETASAFGSFTGAALVVICSLVWLVIDRNKS